MRYCFTILFLISQAAFAQSFITRVSPKIIGKEDVLQVEYVADGAEMDQFNLPKFVNWTIVSGPNISSSKIVSGNGVKQQTTYSVMLLPQITGVIIIPGATALINNRPQRSNQVSVQVKNVAHVGGQTTGTPQAGAPLFDFPPITERLPANQFLKKGESAVDKIKNNIFVRLEVSKQTCYVGEPIIATYKLCSRLRSRSKVVKQPTFSGCTVDELTQNYTQQHVENINGQDYNVFTIRKVRLTPLDAGTLELPPTSVENDVSFYTSDRRDAFGNPAGPTEDHVITLQNKPSVISVKPLPPFAGNGTFSGAIGNFNIGLRPGENTYTTNGTNHLLFIVEGPGNLQPVKAPQMNWPKGLEPFEAVQNEELDRENTPVIAHKVFTIPFVADKIGNYVLPQVSFTYFDPNAEKYVTKATSAYLFKVIPGSKSIINKNASDNGLGDFDQRLFVLLGAALLAVIIGIAWYSGTRRSKLPPEIKRPEPKEEINETAQKDESAGMEYLYKINELEPSENTSAFYKQLNKYLSDYLYQKFQIQPADLTTYADQHLNVAVPLHQFRTLIDDCTLGMYTPVFSMDEALQHRRQAIEVVEKLEREFRV